SGVAALQKMVEQARGRVGAGATGILIDDQGLVIASGQDPNWLLRPLVSLKPDVASGMMADQRWGNNPAPEPLGLTDLAPALATGDLDVTINITSQDELGEMADAFGTMLVQLRQLTGEVQGGAQSLSGAGEAIMAAVAQQSAGATAQSAAIAETSATVEEVK